MRLAWLMFLTLAAASAPAQAVEIDGQLQPGEWAGARHVTDFRQTQPLNGQPGTLHTEAWILATPEGLAVAFRCGDRAGGAAAPVVLGTPGLIPRRRGARRARATDAA